MWNMHDFYWCGVKQGSDYLHHGSGGVGLEADSKFTKQDWMRSKKKLSPHTSVANIDVFHVWGKCILSCNDTTFTTCLQYFSFFWFYNTTFFHSGHVIKLPQPSSAMYEAPSFTGNLILVILAILVILWYLQVSS